jgi:hypothetical protein
MFLSHAAQQGAQAGAVIEVFESHELGKAMMFIPLATIAQRIGGLFPTMCPLLTKE